MVFMILPTKFDNPVEVFKLTGNPYAKLPANISINAKLMSAEIIKEITSENIKYCFVAGSMLSNIVLF